MDQITRLKQGCCEVFQEIFSRWHGEVYSYLLLKSKDSCIAEEVTQITFIKLWEFRQTLSDNYSIESQLFRIARTCFIDNLRSRARRRNLLVQVSATYSQGWSYMALPDQQRHIDSALQKLPPLRRKAFMLSRLDGLSYKEIASQMDISDRTVEKHISMALKQLKKIMAVTVLVLIYLHH